MKVVIQRVNKSSVEINNKIKSEIQKGLLVLIGIGLDDDKKDAGEMGAGHTVTALYEIVPAGGKIDVPKVDKLKYAKKVECTNSNTYFHSL